MTSADKLKMPRSNGGAPLPGFPPEALEQGYGHWLWQFLKEELAPYPGRISLVARMIVSGILTMLIFMVFRLPGGALAVAYSLLLSRESPSLTLSNFFTTLLAYLVGGIYCVISAMLFVGLPSTHFLWVVFTLLLCFAGIRVMTNPLGAIGFGFMVTLAVPYWDQNLPVEALLESTLWTTGAAVIGLLTTLAVEYAFALGGQKDELRSGLEARLDAVRSSLERSTDSQETRSARELSKFWMVGVSRLRQLAMRPSANKPNVFRSSAVVALVGRLVDLTATIRFAPDLSDEMNREQFRSLAEQVRTLREWVLEDSSDSHTLSHGIPIEGAGILAEMQHTVNLLRIVSSGLMPEEGLPPPVEQPRSRRVFLPDVFSNHDHLLFALRGCLAASSCYVFMNAVAWPGLSTSLATCLITALSSIGSSRQRQLLRITGAVIGGIVFGLGAQAFILPALDGIFGFTLLFALVAFVSAWFFTCSTRLSYLGLQIALAFDLIHLQEAYPQTDLGIGRDRVFGVLLGLVSMWLFFDTLGSKPAIQVMYELFSKNLRVLSELSKLGTDGSPLNLTRILEIRDLAVTNFNSVNAQGDAVLFETGIHRNRDLWLRQNLRNWQPRLRALLLCRISILHYRFAVGHHISSIIKEAQSEFDLASAAALDAFARQLEQCRNESRSLPDKTFRTPQLTTLRQIFDKLSATFQRQEDPDAYILAILALDRTVMLILEHISEPESVASSME